MRQETSILGKILQLWNSSRSSWGGYGQIITESLSLEGTSGCHLVQLSFTDEGQLEQVAQKCVQLGFECLQGWRIYNFSVIPINYHPQSIVLECLSIGTGLMRSRNQNYPSVNDRSKLTQICLQIKLKSYLNLKHGKGLENSLFYFFFLFFFSIFLIHFTV